MADSTVEYFRRSGGLNNMPRNEFEHAEGLLHSEYDLDKEFLQATQIVDKYVQLCNIGKGAPARLEAIQADNLTHYQDMAMREPELKRSFIRLVHGWRNGLLISKAVEGKERDKQGALGGAPSPSGPYGFTEDQTPKEDKRNFIQRLLGKKA
jgi:hypothetical protein